MRMTDMREEENNKISVREAARRMKADSCRMAALSGEERNAILEAVRRALLAGKDEIFAANAADRERAVRDGAAPAIMKRLLFDERKLRDVTEGIGALIKLPDPLGRVQLARELDDGLRLYRTTCPIGVIGVIFEARPDALVQIAALCLKSGNCAILKGGKETALTNRALFDAIYRAAASHGAPEVCLYQAGSHAEIAELLECHGTVDLLIPRGSNAFVQYIIEHTKIPVMGHADGVCHVYVDGAADPAKARSIVLDAKTQYTAACNAAETLLIKRSAAGRFLPDLAAVLWEAGVRLYGTREVCDILGACGKERPGFGAPVPCEEMAADDFHTEYLDLAMSVALVEDVEEAAAHINRYGSHHTDAIVTEDREIAERFMQLVDSAGVYQNCSTRFADGYRYGFGAEVGISTGKLHARGPVGLEGLVTYRYRLYGDGHIVGDYASGRKSFHFKEL